jgi:hypothetical protein
MKFRMVVVTAAAAALSFAAVGSAAAQPLLLGSQHEPASPPQVNGPRLATALLPASDFGEDFVADGGIVSGSKLQTTQASKPVSGQSCEQFEDNEYVSFVGDTAGADKGYLNTAWRVGWPYDTAIVDQDVVQFATTRQATTYFGQAYAKYAACRSFTVPNPGDTVPGGGSFDAGSVSVSKTSVSGHQAFAAAELWAPSEESGRFLHIDVLFVVSGTNVYNLWQVDGTNNRPSYALMSDLIRRVQALYP